MRIQNCNYDDIHIKSFLVESTNSEVNTSQMFARFPKLLFRKHLKEKALIVNNGKSVAGQLIILLYRIFVARSLS